jgi:hypothetical protein
MRNLFSIFLLCVVSSTCVTVAAQTMYRCGNVYQDRQCESSAGTVIGSTKAAAPSAPKDRIGASARTESQAANLRNQASSGYNVPPQTTSGYSRESAVSANQERARTESLAKSNKEQVCGALKASVDDLISRQRVGGDVHVMEDLRRQRQQVDKRMSDANC